MKVFSKFLAVILALVTVLTLIPFSVFAKEEASEPWLEVESDGNPDAPVVTVKVDAAAFMELLRTDGSLIPSISDLRSGITLDLASLMNVFTVQELFEIIPQEDLFGILPLESIIEQIGMEKLETYVDKAELINSVSKEDLTALLEDIDDLTVIVDAEEALKTIDKALLLKYMDEDAVFSEVDVWDAVDMIFGDPAFNVSNLKNVVKIETLISGTSLKWDEIIDLNVLTNDAAIIDIVAQYVQVNTSDLAKVEALLDGDPVEDYVDIDVVTGTASPKIDKIVKKVGVPGLMASDIVTVDLDGIMGNSTVSNYVFANMDINVALPKVKEALQPLSAQELETYVNKTAVFDLVDLDEAVELLGGYEAAQKYVDVPALLADPALNIADLVPFVLMDKLIAEVGFSALVALVPTSALIAQLDNNEMYEILLGINIRPYATKLLALIVRKTLSNVDELVIDGEVVASEDDKQMLQIHSAALLNALNKARPTLTDIINTEDGKILSTYVSFKYTVDGTEEQKSKEMTIELVLEGDLTREQAIAQSVSNLMNRYISYSYKNGTLTADVNLPAGCARFFNRVLNSNKLDAATKQKLLNVANWDGEHLTGVLERLTTKDIVNVLRAVDLDKVREIALQYAYVQRCVEIASNFTGIDMSDMDLDALMDYSVKVPGLKRISNIIKNRYGVDVYSALQNYETTDELYEAALNRAEASVNAFERATDMMIRMINTYIPESAMNLSLMDGYNGNGNFTLNKNVSFNAKNLAVKALKRLVKFSGLNINTEAFDVLLSQVADGTTTLKLDLSLQVADVYSITYKDQATGDTLFTAFLPVGADLSVFQNKEATGGIEITDWMDEDGNVITHMPARDVVVYTGRKEVSVTFVDKDGNLLDTFTVFSGDTLAAHLDAIYAIEEKIETPSGSQQFLYNSLDVTWNRYNPETGEIGSRWMLTRSPVMEDMTVIADTSRPSYYLFMEDVDYDVVLNQSGSNYDFVIQVHEELPEFFSLNMDYKTLLSMANMSYNVTLTMEIGKDKYAFFKMDDALLASFRKAATGSVSFNFGTTPANADKSVYANDELARFFTFEILTDGNPYSKNFASDLIITLPYEMALTSADGAHQATRIHVLHADGSRESIERLNDEQGYVSFKAPHFSEYVVSNEYKLNLSFVSTEASDPTAIFGSLRGHDSTDVYFPAGCELKAIPVVSAENVNNYTWFSTVYKYGEMTEAEGLYYGEIFVMPAAEVDMKVTVSPRICNVYYYVLGELFGTDTYFFYQTVAKRAENDPIIMAKDPDGMPSAYKWVGFDSSLIGICDMYVSAKWNDVVYMVQFIGRDGTPIKTVEFDESNYYTIVPPAVPVETGYVGVWSKYDLKSAFGKEEGYTIKVNAIYTEAVFNIYSDGIVSVAKSAKFGETVTVYAPDKAGYDKAITVTMANETTQTVENGVFVMPEGDVYVDVTYVPHEYKYTINGFEFTGKRGETITFEVPVPLGKVLAIAPEGCTLSSATLDADRNLILTYSFELFEDGTAITWKWGESEYNILQIINGKLFDGKGVPVSSNEDAVFLGWSPVVADYLQFAIFGIHEEPASWLWLWILVILLVLIGLVVLFYLLYKAGKIGLNAFTRVIVWIANLFFTVCIAVANLGLKIAGLFGKGKSEKEYGLESAEEASDKKED